MGDAVRLRLPRPHERRAVAGDRVERRRDDRRGEVDRSTGARPDAGLGESLDDPLVGPSERPGGARLDGVETRQAIERPEGLRLGEALDDGRRERAATDLDEDAVEAAIRPPASCGGELPAERLAALDGEAVLVALAGERDRPRGDGRAQTRDRRVAGHASRTRADLTCAPSSAEARDDGRIGRRRDEDVEGSAGGRATTAAARAALPQLAIASGRPPGTRPSASSTSSSRSVPMRWRALCEPRRCPSRP